MNLFKKNYFNSNWLLQYKNSQEKFIKLSIIILILITIGLARLVLEVKFNIDLNKKWYSFDKDIIFVMSVFAFYLCFFLSMAAHLILKLFKIKADFKKLFLLFFILQIFHLIIPFFDYLGFKFNISNTFEPYLNCGACSFNPFINITNIWQILIMLTPLIIFFTKPGLLTLGITVTWISIGVIFERYLAKELKINITKRVLIVLILFQVIYWPIYKYFIIFDWTFYTLTTINYYNHYGYGIYFLIFGIIGFIYFLKQTKNEVGKIN